MFVVPSWITTVFIFMLVAAVCLLILGVVGLVVLIYGYVLIKMPALVVLPIRIQPIWEMLTERIRFE